MLTLFIYVWTVINGNHQTCNAISNLLLHWNIHPSLRSFLAPTEEGIVSAEITLIYISTFGLVGIIFTLLSRIEPKEGMCVSSCTDLQSSNSNIDCVTWYLNQHLCQRCVVTCTMCCHARTNVPKRSHHKSLCGKRLVSNMWSGTFFNQSQYCSG